jgi:hypothetical protein
MRSLRRASVLLTLLAGVLVFPGWHPSIHAQPIDNAKARRELLEGTDLFRRILHDKGCKPLKNFLELESDAKHSIFIVLGDLDSIARMKFVDLGTFVRSGGAVLAASDRPFRNAKAQNQLLDVAGVVISHYLPRCNRLDSCYKKLTDCPFVDPISGSRPFLFRTGDGANTEAEPLRVATNIPSMLEVVRRRLPGGIRRLARLPEGCYFAERPRTIGAEVPPLFAVGGELEDGRVLVLADHSIFINEMMLPTDNDNVEFTEECVDWLRGPKGQRKRVLFVDERGDIQTQFNIPLKSVNIPIEEIARTIFERRNELLGDAERLVGRWEDENAFNRWLLNGLGWVGLTPRRLLFLAMSFGALALVLYFTYRGIRRRFRHETAVPVLAHAIARGLPVEPVAEQRHAELLQSGNLWEPASLMARRWFVRLGIERTGTEEPAFVARGGWWQRRKVVGRLRRLWRLAGGRLPQRVSGGYSASWMNSRASGSVEDGE